MKHKRKLQTIFLTGTLAAFSTLTWYSASALSSSVALPQKASASPEKVRYFFSHLAEKVVPSVVNISTTARVRRDENAFPKHWDQFFGVPRFRPGPPGRLPPAQSLGSGVIIKTEGRSNLILTNLHVIKGAEQIKIHFNKTTNEQPVTATVIAKDPDLDLALLKAKSTKKLSALPIGKSSELKVGEFVMAVGNPFGQGHTVSHGIISAKERNTPMILGKYLQTDAPINPGNSGGPLVNMDGEIIGINNAIIAQAQGIGFAIPSDSISRVLPQLENDGKVTRGYLGILMGEVSQEAAAFSSGDLKPGVPYVADVEPNSPAEQAGLQPNDVIVKFNDKKISTPDELLESVTATPVGTSVDIQVIRAGRKKVFDIKVVPRPT